MNNPIRGRGVSRPQHNRFERLQIELDPDALEELRALDPEARPPAPQTVFYDDDSQSIISTNDSPDLSFDASLNPYRGCEHGCAYCYARPYHEYLGFNAGLDFETKIMVKRRAPELLRRELSRESWVPRTLVCSGATDAYQPVERGLGLTRACLEVLRDFRNPVAIITKNHLVTRDLDLLAELASHRAAAVFISLTTLDPKLAAALEPRASSPRFRLEAMRRAREAGIPVGVSIAPRIPGLNDHETPALLEAAADHGAMTAFYTVVRLAHGLKKIFAEWLEDHYPGRKELVLGRIRELRGGKMNDGEFGTRMRGTGALAEDTARLFKVAARRHGLDTALPPLSTAAFRRCPDQTELELF